MQGGEAFLVRRVGARAPLEQQLDARGAALVGRNHERRAPPRHGRARADPRVVCQQQADRLHAALRGGLRRQAERPVAARVEAVDVGARREERAQPRRGERAFGDGTHELELLLLVVDDDAEPPFSLRHFLGEHARRAGHQESRLHDGGLCRVLSRGEAVRPQAWVQCPCRLCLLGCFHQTQRCFGGHRALCCPPQLQVPRESRSARIDPRAHQMAVAFAAEPASGAICPAGELQLRCRDCRHTTKPAIILIDKGHRMRVRAECSRVVAATEAIVALLLCGLRRSKQAIVP